jgi:hypothetical protein
MKKEKRDRLLVRILRCMNTETDSAKCEQLRQLGERIIEEGKDLQYEPMDKLLASILEHKPVQVEIPRPTTAELVTGG